MGWRSALWVLAALQLPFGVLTHGLTLRNKKGSRLAVMQSAAIAPGRVMRAMAQPVFWLLALSYAAHAFMFTGLTFHIIPLLSERGFSLPIIVAAYSVVGPFQVIGRFTVFALERYINVRFAGFVSTSLPIIAISLLMLASPGSALLYVFAVFYGAGMGIKTIVQATAGPEFLGKEGYGALQGTFAGINFVVQAATPFALAVLWTVMGNYAGILWILFAAAGLSGVAFLVAVVLRTRALPA